MFVFLNSLERFHIENLVGRKIFLLMNSLLFIIPESHGKILTESHKVYLNWSSACFVYIHYTNRQQVVGKGAIVWKTCKKKDSHKWEQVSMSHAQGTHSVVLLIHVWPSAVLVGCAWVRCHILIQSLRSRVTLTDQGLLKMRLTSFSFNYSVCLAHLEA